MGGSAGLPALISKYREQGKGLGLTADAAEALVRRYGTNTPRVLAHLNGADQGSLPADIYASLMYAIGEEMAVKPADFLIRRTGAMFFDMALVHAWKDEVIRIMSAELGYSPEQEAAYRAELELQMKDAVVPSAKN